MSIITDTYYENKSVKKHIYMYYKKCVHVVIEIYKYEKYIHIVIHKFHCIKTIIIIIQKNLILMLKNIVYFFLLLFVNDKIILYTII